MKYENSLLALQCKVESLESAVVDAMYLLSEIDTNEVDPIKGISGIFARCAYARLQQSMPNKDLQFIK